jgi:hypothetical protein
LASAKGPLTRPLSDALGAQIFQNRGRSCRLAGLIVQALGQPAEPQDCRPALEVAARLNKEIGLGSGEAPTGVTIIFKSNIRPRAPRPGLESGL